MRDPRTPVDDVARIAQQINHLQDQIDRLNNPSGTSAYQAVAKLQALIDDIQTQLNEYIANGTYNKAQIDSMFADTPGPMSVSGSLSVDGTLSAGGLLRADAGISSLDVFNTQINMSGPRVALWADSSGKIGHT